MADNVAVTADDIAGKLNEGEDGNEIVDPGTLEGTRSDKSTPSEGSPRWEKVYAKMKGFERELESTKAEKESLISMVEEMKDWNKTLAESLEKNASTIASAIADKGDNVNVEENIQIALKELKNEYKDAMKNVDYDAAADINEKILDLKLDLKELKILKEKKVSTINTPVIRQNAGDSHPDVVKFVKSTPWFSGENADPEMKAYALMLDDVLIDDVKWKNKPASERLEEVKLRVEKRFAWENPNRSRSDVEGGDKGRPKPGSGASLNNTELEIAKGLGLSPEAIAKQKEMIKRGRK